MNTNKNDDSTQETSTNPSKPTIVSGSTSSHVDYQDVLKSIHSTGTWAIVLGVLNIILSPLLENLVYTQASAKGQSKATLVITALILGLIVGGIFIGLGIKLKRATADKIHQADRTLLWLVAALALVMILSLFAVSNAGLLNIILLFKITQTRGKIKKIGKG